MPRFILPALLIDYSIPILFVLIEISDKRLDVGYSICTFTLLVPRLNLTAIRHTTIMSSMSLLLMVRGHCER